MELDDDAYLPEVHPTFAAHFTDDFAPLGSDALARQVGRYGEQPQFTTMTRDLASFA